MGKNRNKRKRKKLQGHGQRNDRSQGHGRRNDRFHGQNDRQNSNDNWQPRKKRKFNSIFTQMPKPAKKKPRPQLDPLQSLRQRLPVFETREEILHAISSNSNVIVVGPTGSGKSTQICQYILEESLNKGKLIGVVQPRRIAAINLAKRVSEEKESKLGDLVGYHVRFDEKTSEQTKIKFVTNGMLVREAMRKKGLKDYAIIILDEAHERSLQTDVLFGILKRMQSLKNSQLKVIAMSATLEAEKFAKYFNDSPIVQVEGRMYPVEIGYLESSKGDHLEAALTAIQQVHIGHANQPGDILVFMTGRDEIENGVAHLQEQTKKDERLRNLLVLPFYSSLSPQKQQSVFKPCPKGKRKVILSTNIAETSLTIQGIRYVIDSGNAKKRQFEASSGIEVLRIEPISRSEAWQRSGRAGREAPGMTLRLYTEENFEKRPESIKPEILRVNLAHVILQLKSLKIRDVRGFDFMDKPEDQSMLAALKHLVDLDALDNSGDITKLGRTMVQFPVSPLHAKVIALSLDAKCSVEILKIISLMNVDGSIFFQSDRDKKVSEKQRVYKSFRSEYGDPLSLLNVWNSWEQSDFADKWCENHFVNRRSLQNARHIHKQLYEIFERAVGTPESCGEDNLDAVRQCLFLGFQSQIAILQPGGEYYRVTGKNTKAKIHPSSFLFHFSKAKKPKHIIFFELAYTNRLWLRDCLAVEEMWIRGIEN